MDATDRRTFETWMTFFFHWWRSSTLGTLGLNLKFLCTNWPFLYNSSITCTTSRCISQTRGSSHVLSWTVITSLGTVQKQYHHPLILTNQQINERWQTSSYLVKPEGLRTSAVIRQLYEKHSSRHCAYQQYKQINDTTLLYLELRFVVKQYCLLHIVYSLFIVKSKDLCFYA